MCYFTDSYCYLLTVSHNNRNVFLSGCVCGVRDKFFKVTALAVSLEKFGYNCSALASEKLHSISPPAFKLNKLIIYQILKPKDLST